MGEKAPREQHVDPARTTCKAARTTCKAARTTCKMAAATADARPPPPICTDTGLAPKIARVRERLQTFHLGSRPATLKAPMGPGCVRNEGPGGVALKNSRPRKVLEFLKSAGLGGRCATLQAQLGPDTCTARAQVESPLKIFCLDKI